MQRFVTLFLLFVFLTPNLKADDIADLKTIVSLQQTQIRQQNQIIETQGKQIQQLINSAGTGNNLSLTGAVNFGTQTRQMLNLWSTEYAIGVQAYTQYFRTHGNFAFYQDGVHSDTMLDPGAGGRALMTIGSDGSIKNKNGQPLLTYVGCSFRKEISGRPDDLDRCPARGGLVVNGYCYMISCTGQ